MMLLSIVLGCIFINAWILYDYIWTRSTTRTVFLSTAIAMSLVFEILGSIRYRYGKKRNVLFVIGETFDIKYANELVLRSFYETKMTNGIVTRTKWKRMMMEMYDRDVAVRSV